MVVVSKKTHSRRVVPLAALMLAFALVSMIFIGFFAHYNVALEASLVVNTPTDQVSAEKNLRTPSTVPVVLFNGTTGCTIDPLTNGLTFLGSGDRGHAFATLLTCPSGNSEKIAFKVAKTWDTKSPHYISSSHVDQKRALYERMLANHTKARTYVSVQLGTATLQRDMLYDGMNQANQHVSRQVVNVTDDDSSLIVDFFAASNDGIELSKLLRNRNAMTPPIRRQIAKDLVYIYRHLYETAVLHCDVRMNHILYSPSGTMLIDFEEFRFLDQAKYRLQTQQEQVWQLLALLGNVCAHGGSSVQFTFDVPWASCNFKTRNKTQVMQRLVPALHECGFDPPMVWHDETGVDVAQTYKDLASWCGL